jgi:hypothetical protein
MGRGLKKKDRIKWRRRKARERRPKRRGKRLVKKFLSLQAFN